jgi:hypothetical protein
LKENGINPKELTLKYSPQPTPSSSAWTSSTFLTDDPILNLASFGDWKIEKLHPKRCLAKLHLRWRGMKELMEELVWLTYQNQILICYL